MRNITDVDTKNQLSPVLSYRYALKVTPDQVGRMNREQLQQLCMEQMYLLWLIIAIIRNPLAAMASRIITIDLLISFAEKTIYGKLAEITERSRIYISGEGGIAKRLGIHANTVSKSLKALEAHQLIQRDYVYDEEKQKEYLDVTLTPISLRQPLKLQDKTKRKLTEAGTPKKQKEPQTATSLPIISLSCPDCGSEDLQITCKGCGITGDIEEFTQGPQTLLTNTTEQESLRQTNATASWLEETPPTETPATSEPVYYTNFVQSSNNAPLSMDASSFENEPMPAAEEPDANEQAPVPQTATIGQQLTTWLERRIGREQGARIIFATGNPTSEKKYMAKASTYEPNIRAYLLGLLDHIYGSYQGRPDGSTYVLTYDFDTREEALNADIDSLLRQLAQAGAAPIYWQRQNNRGHLELYFETPVSANKAYEWCIAQCPRLAAVEEVYPARDKQNSPLSWPLWQRKGKSVLPCQAKAVLPSDPETILSVSPTERKALARLVTQAVTPSSLIPLPDPEPTRQALPASQPLIVETPRLSDADIARIVIMEFNQQTSWDDLIERCGGVNRSGKFAAIWRGETTPSVKVDADERAACDYGRIGTYPKKMDKYEMWCLIERVTKKADLAKRCAAYRQRQGEGPQAQLETLSTVLPGREQTLPDSRVETEIQVIPLDVNTNAGQPTQNELMSANVRNDLEGNQRQELPAPPKATVELDVIRDYGRTREWAALVIDGEEIVPAGKQEWLRFVWLSQEKDQQRRVYDYIKSQV